MDFLATYAAVNLDGALISKEITGIMGCQVGLSKDLYGSDLQAKSTSGTTTSISMTLLLKHTVAHSSRPFFRPTTSRINSFKAKNGKILSIEVNFLFQKLSEAFYFLLTNIILGTHFLLLTFFTTSILKPLSFLKRPPIFGEFYSTDCQT